jgi:hypothetical protein
MADIPTTTTTKNKNFAVEVCCLCKIIQKKQASSSYFMDDPDVIDAINTNNPKKLTKMTHSFTENALSKIQSLIQVGKGDNMLSGSYALWAIKQMRNNFGHFMVCADSSNYSVDKKIGLREQIFITMQLMLWSCISEAIYNCIVKTLSDSNVNSSHFWSWLQSVTKCVSGTVSCVYNMHATPFEKEHPCEVLLLASSIHHMFAAFVILAKEDRQVLSPKLLAVNNSSPPKSTGVRLRLVTKSYLSFLKGMTKPEPVTPGIRKEHRLDFYLEELGQHSNVWIGQSHIIICIARLFRFEYVKPMLYRSELCRVKRKCR